MRNSVRNSYFNRQFTKRVHPSGIVELIWCHSGKVTRIFGQSIDEAEERAMHYHGSDHKS